MKYLYTLLIIIPKLAFTQNFTKVNYEYMGHSARLKTPSTLLVKDGSYWYSRHQEPNIIDTEEGYTFYYYKDYIDWYYDYSAKTISEVWEKDNYPPFYGQWKPDMKWEITQETKEIGGYKVQKATTTPLLDSWHKSIKLLNVNAWFATDIPISAGPEGYYGLPGLIIKLEYEGIVEFENEKTSKIFSTYSITMKNIVYESVEKWKIPNDVGKIKIAQEQFGNITKIDSKWLKEQKKLLKQNNK